MNLPELNWRVQTRAVHQMKTPPRMLQDLLFKIRNPIAADVVEVDLIKAGKKRAPFVTELEGGTIVEGTTRESRLVKTSRMRPKKPLTAKDLLTERGEGQIFYANGAGSINQARQQKIARENLNLKNLIANTTEWMCAQAITGVMTVSQENIEFQVNYLIPSAHKIVLSSGSKWSDTDVDVLEDFQTFVDKLINAGYTPDICICGTNAAKHMRQKIKKDEWFDARRISAGSFNWNATSKYMGNLLGIDVYRYGSSTEDDDGTESTLINPNKIYISDSTARYTIEFGNILDLDAGANVVGEIFAKNWQEKDPSVLWLLQESRPLPVVWEPESIIEATVV